MTSNLSIQSVGAPPERHSDRVVAEMLRQLAQARARLWPEMWSAINSSSDGSPKAQRKMAARIKRAGAIGVDLEPGKRGRYTLTFYHSCGWDPGADKAIDPGDPIPARPWIAYYTTIIESSGNGRLDARLVSAPLLFVTHHALSRTAQRFGARTTDHLLNASTVIWNAAIMFASEIGIDKWLGAPLQGWRAPLDEGKSSFVVLKRHKKHNALVAATVIAAHE